MITIVMLTHYLQVPFNTANI